MLLNTGTLVRDQTKSTPYKAERPRVANIIFGSSNSCHARRSASVEPQSSIMNLHQCPQRAVRVSDLSQLLEQLWRKEIEAQKTGQPVP